MANEAQNIKQTKGISPIKQSGAPVLMPARRLTPFEEMDQLLENFFPRSWGHPLRREWPTFNEAGAGVRAPRIDVINRDEDIIVRAEVPGVNKDDLDISLTENTITIQGSSDRQEKEEKGNYYRCEISRGTFSRSVVLPSDVDEEKAKAVFKDGMLEVTLPKVEKSKRRSIQIE